MKYRITFNETVEEGRDSVTHGGVSFHNGKATEVDGDAVELSPWFVGNPSFTVEAIEDETTKNQTRPDDVAKNSRAGNADKAADSGSKGSDGTKEAVKPAVKRARKSASK